jgi:hypothetical protein
MNTFSVIHVPADQVGAFLGLSGTVAVGSFVLAFVMRDQITDDPNRSMLSLAAMAAIFMVTLGLSAL